MNEQSAIDSFSKGVPDIPGLIAGDSRCHCVSVNPDGLACQSSDKIQILFRNPLAYSSPHELLLANTQEECSSLHIILLRNVGRIIDVVRFVADVSHVEDGGQDFEDVPDVLVSHLQHLHGATDLGKLGRVVSSITTNHFSLRL